MQRHSDENRRHQPTPFSRNSQKAQVTSEISSIYILILATCTIDLSWKNAQTAQTRLCYFSGLLGFLPVEMQVLFFAFFCEN